MDDNKTTMIFNKPLINNYDTVDHPQYYNQGNIEVIDYIEDQGMMSGFCLGNAIKYISRAGKKNPETEIEDLSKARWYLDKYIKYLQDKNG
jgi:hypothetical protein